MLAPVVRGWLRRWAVVRDGHRIVVLRGASAVVAGPLAPDEAKQLEGLGEVVVGLLARDPDPAGGVLKLTRHPQLKGWVRGDGLAKAELHCHIGARAPARVVLPEVGLVRPLVGMPAKVRVKVGRLVVVVRIVAATFPVRRRRDPGRAARETGVAVDRALQVASQWRVCVGADNGDVSHVQTPAGLRVVQRHLPDAQRRWVGVVVRTAVFCNHCHVALTSLERGYGRRWQGRWRCRRRWRRRRRRWR